MQPRSLVYSLGFIIAIGPISVDMYLPAFSGIAAEFGASVPQLTLASYFAGFAAGQLVQGWLSDGVGRRLSLACGLVLYILASFACAATHDALDFCVMRGLAAFGAAASIVVPRAIVRDLADGPPAAELMSDVLQIMSIAPVVAPLLGSLVLMVAGWRMIFVLAGLYGVAGLWILLRNIPETLPRESRIRVDPLAVLRLYRTVLGDSTFVANALIGACGMAALFAYLAGAPAVFMAQNGIRPGSFSLILAALGASMVSFFRINRWLVVRHGAVYALNAGIIVWLVAGLAFCLIAWTGHASAIPVVAVLLAFSLGYSFIPSNAQVRALGGHAAHAATATALMSTLQYCSGAAAGALVGILADGTARPVAGIILGSALAAAALATYLGRRLAVPVM